jgi:RHS repeat-associated protein
MNRDGLVDADDLTWLTLALADTNLESLSDLRDYRFLYRGYQYDHNLGVYHVRNRVLDSRIQRWLQPDPAMFADGFNRYAYCENDPVNKYDPMGLDAYWVGSILRSVGLDQAGEVMDDLADGAVEGFDAITGVRDANDAAHAASVTSVIIRQAQQQTKDSDLRVYITLQMSDIHAVSQIAAVENQLIAETKRDILITAASLVIPIKPIANGLGTVISRVGNAALVRIGATQLGRAAVLSSAIQIKTIVYALETAIGGKVVAGAARQFFAGAGTRVAGGAVVGQGARTTVLGHYPQYVELAKQMSANRFQIPAKVWEQLSDAERWAANQRFLDRAVARGDSIILATPITEMRLGSWYAREIEYLRSLGYRPSCDGSRLLPGQ